MSAPTRFTDPTLPEPPALYLALELSNRSWKLAFSTGHGQKPRFRNVPARDLAALTREIALARTRFELPDSVPVISCFEAGRDGFWIHRFLQTQPHCFNLVVDSPLLPQLRQRLEREWLHRCDVSHRIRFIEKLQCQRFEASTHDPALELVRQLMSLKGIGLQSAWLFTFEFFAWRNIQNRREIAGLAGFTPTPYQSGDDSFDQGISKAGSSTVRAMAIQIAWGWLLFQPDSALTLWHQRRFASRGLRMRKIGIVALARGLLIELWRFSETGSLPEGAITSP